MRDAAASPMPTQTTPATILTSLSLTSHPCHGSSPARSIPASDSQSGIAQPMRRKMCDTTTGPRRSRPSTYGVRNLAMGFDSGGSCEARIRSRRRNIASTNARASATKQGSMKMVGRSIATMVPWNTFLRVSTSTTAESEKTATRPAMIVPAQYKHSKRRVFASPTTKKRTYSAGDRCCADSSMSSESSLVGSGTHQSKFHWNTSHRTRGTLPKR